MSKHLRIFFMVNMALVFALVGSGVLQPAVRVQAGYWFPHMIVTPHLGSSYYNATAYVGQNLNFQTKVVNDGNVALQIIGILTPPSGWELNSQYDDCPDYLAVGSTCTLTWVFVPQVSGQALVRVYVRGFYTDSYGYSQRITQSPGFFFNIVPVGQVISQSSGTTTTSTGSSIPFSYFPDIIVKPHVGNFYYSYPAQVGKQITFETKIINNGNIPLQVVANLTPPFHWDVVGQYDDCPDSLAVRSTCTFTWQFIPQISGPAVLRVFARGLYTDSSGIPQRVAKSPALLFTVAP
jgi:hypothetical protein